MSAVAIKSFGNPGCERQSMASSHVWCGVVAWLMLACVLPSPAIADSGLDDYNVAVGLYKQRRWKPAAEQFQVFLKTYKKHEKTPLAKLYLGLTRISLEEFTSARDILRLFVKENPQNVNVAQARYRIAECSYLLNELATARTEFDSYLRTFPRDPFQDHALPYLADVQLRLNDPTSALATFQKAMADFPDGPLVEDAKFGVARSLESLKRVDQAEEKFRELAANVDSPRAADAVFHLAAIAFDRQEYPQAAALYIDLTQKFPDSRLVSASHLNAGYAFYHSSQFVPAIAQFESAANQKTQRVIAGLWRGLSLKALGKTAEAVDVFKQSAALVTDDAAEGELLRFQQAFCERQLGYTAEARQGFEAVLSRWPQGDYADDSLHALAELAIDAGELTTAHQRLDRFSKDYPQSDLKLRVQLLSGRLELADAAVALREQKAVEHVSSHYEAAAERFESVIKETAVAKMKNQAIYYLAFVRQLQGRHALAIELISPLAQQAQADGAESEWGDALILQAESLFLENKMEAADGAVATYLDLFPQGRKAAGALSIQSVQAARRQNLAAADAALQRLNEDFAVDHPIRISTTQQLCDLADASKDWVRSARLYSQLISLTKDTDRQAYAIRGLAVSQRHQKQDLEAAATFARVRTNFPDHRIAVECEYYRAESLKDAGETDAAIAAFEGLLKQVSTETPASPSVEEQAPWLYSYRAGLQAARLHRQAKRVLAADAAYQDLLTRFPKPQKLDQVIDEWAVLNYEAQKYERADEIFRRLVQEMPSSELADNAQLSLAESELIASRLDAARQIFQGLLVSDKSDQEVKERSLYQLIVLAVDQGRWVDVRILDETLRSQFLMSPYRWYADYSVAESILANDKTNAQELSLATERLTAICGQRDNPTVSGLPWFDRAWVLLSEVQFRQKQYEALAQTVEDLRQRSAKSAFLYQAEEVLGRGYKQQAPPQWEKARLAFERVIADPVAFRTETAAKSQFLIGETYFLQEEWPKAFIAYQKVYSNYDFPEWQAAALLQSGACDEHQQDWKAAAATYHLLLERFVDSKSVLKAKQRLAAIEGKK